MVAVTVEDEPNARVNHAMVEAFLYHEARLLDDQQFEQWGALFIEDGEYWIPATYGQPDALNHVSHMYEDAALREIHITRFSAPNAFSLQPMPHSTHIVSNVVIDAYDSTANLITCSSRFSMTQFHRDSVTQFFGECVHQLLIQGEEFRIKQKRVNLVNCEGMLGDLVLYI